MHLTDTTNGCRKMRTNVRSSIDPPSLFLSPFVYKLAVQEIPQLIGVRFLITVLQMRARTRCVNKVETTAPPPPPIYVIWEILSTF